MRRFLKIGLFSVLAGCLSGLIPCSAEDAVPYGMGSWSRLLGNHRAVVEVREPAEAVWVHIPWRRRDAAPEDKAIVVVDLTTGQQLRNVARVAINRDFGDLVFEPKTFPGQYAIYYYPLELIESRPTGTTDFTYREPFSAADSLWLERNALGDSRYFESDFRSRFPTATLVKIEARSEFDRFDPMELVASAKEIKRLKKYFSGQTFWLFPEDRRFPIRMTDDLPLRWIEKGPGDRFAGLACQNEFYTFQVGVYALEQSLLDLTVQFGDLRNAQGQLIPKTAFTCFNLGGVDALGKTFVKEISVPKGKVEALWFGVQISSNAEPGVYKGQLLVGPSGGKQLPVELDITVEDKRLADGGVSDLSRFSRLKWLNSTAGQEPTVTGAYTAMQREGRKVSCLGKEVVFSETGLPESIQCGDHEILDAPIRFVIETTNGPMVCSNAKLNVLEETPATVLLQSVSQGLDLQVTSLVRMEFDGYAYYQVKLLPARDMDIKDLRLEIPYKKEMATYMMGLDSGRGGFRKPDVKWTWGTRPNNKVWIGEVEAGLRCKLRGPAEMEDVWAEYKPEVSGIPQSWGNDGKGGCSVTEDEQGSVLFKAYSGPRQLKAGQELSFNFSLLITPVKPRDPKHWCNPEGWNWRYSMLGKSPDIAKILGANAVTAFHSSPQNPWINYPFLTPEILPDWVRQVHGLGMKAKVYFTLGELSNHAVELWPMRSLGDEVYAAGKGGGSEWLQEHLVKNYYPRWYCHPQGMDRPADSSIYLTGMNRWFNYYVRSIQWLVENNDIDGMYFDGARFSRRTLQRIRRVLDSAKPGCLLDYHAGNNITRRSNTYNDAMEHLAYMDSTWIGEGFNYNYSPDFYMVELSGIPFGVPNNMLEGGGNPWRGMLYGMASRFLENHSGTPTALWKFWDEVGIQTSEMIGYWNKTCPVQTGRDDVLATVYKMNGKTLLSIASWAKDDASCQLKIDYKSLGLNPAKTTAFAPEILEFQNQQAFDLFKPFVVPQGRGWLILLSETPLSPAPQTQAKVQSLSLDEASLKKACTVRKPTDGDGIIQPVDGGLNVSGSLNTFIYAEQKLPADVSGVQCRLNLPHLKRPAYVYARTDGMNAPGLAVQFEDGKLVRVSFSSLGTVVVEDGIMDHYYRPVSQLREQKAGDWAWLRIRWDADVVRVECSADGKIWECVRAVPREIFKGNPEVFKVGKLAKEYGWPKSVTIENSGGIHSGEFRDLGLLR